MLRKEEKKVNKKFIKSVFTENLLLKLASLIFAAIVWLLVVNINNPNQSRSFTSNVEVINAQVLSEQGKYYTIPEGTNSVTYRVTAPRSIIEKLSSDDFKAVADMSKLEDDTRIPIEISAVNYTSSISISNRQQYLYIEVGEEMEEKFVVGAFTTGDPASGFVVDSVSVDPNIITIRGPESIVSAIDSVRAYCDVSGMNNYISENVVPQLFDANGEKIDATKLTLSQSTVNVGVSFTNVKEVPIELEGQDAPGGEVEVTQILLSPPKATIKGDSSILNDITEIRIPKSVIDLETITGDISTTVDISRYLPEGVSLIEDMEPEVRVEIHTTAQSTVTKDMLTENITVRNLSDNKTYSFDLDKISVELTGLPSAIEGINEKDLYGQVDATGLNIGEHTVRVVMDEIDGISFGTTTVKIIIKNGG